MAWRGREGKKREDSNKNQRAAASLAPCGLCKLWRVPTLCLTNSVSHRSKEQLARPDKPPRSLLAHPRITPLFLPTLRPKLLSCLPIRRATPPLQGPCSWGGGGEAGDGGSWDQWDRNREQGVERRTRLPGVDHEAVEAEFCLVSNTRSLDVFKLRTQGSHGHMEG